MPGISQKLLFLYPDPCHFPIGKWFSSRGPKGAQCPEISQSFLSPLGAEPGMPPSTKPAGSGLPAAPRCLALSARRVPRSLPCHPAGGHKGTCGSAPLLTGGDPSPRLPMARGGDTMAEQAVPRAGVAWKPGPLSSDKKPLPGPRDPAGGRLVQPLWAGWSV